MEYEEFAAYLGAPRPCLICGSSDKSEWAREGIFKAVKCSHCGLIWIDPFLNDEGVRLYYDNFIQHRLEDEKKMRQRDRMYEIDRDFLQQYVSQGRLLDVGRNGGFFLNKLSNRFDKYGIEIDDKAVAYAREHFAFGANVFHRLLGEDGFPTRMFHCVAMRGVIEHLQDPKAAVRRVSDLLRPGGYFFITATPNVESFCAEVYREKWNQFNPIQHLYYFSVSALSRLVEPFSLRLLAKDFPYLETPYADVMADHARVLQDYELISQGRRNEVAKSPAFWGNMMTVLYQKLPES